MFSVLHLVLITLAAIAAGAINALAGGGTLLTFPTLIAVGLPAVAANVTNTVALCPGYVGGTLAQFNDLRGQRTRLWITLPAGVIGGLIGGILLLQTGEKLFRELVPFLILLASALLAIQEPVRRWLTRRLSQGSSAKMEPWSWLPVGLAAIYGGYFGAGMGVLMIGLFLIAAHIGVQESAGLRMWCATGVNTLAVAAFVVKGIVVWRLAIPMLICTLIGGYWGAHAVQRLTPETARRAVLVFAWIMSLWLLVRSWE